MTPRSERRLLQIAVAVFGCVPVFAGLAGALGGGGFTGIEGSVSGESHVRYLSGLLLGIGLAFWAAIPRIEVHGRRVRLLAAIVVVGGLARLIGLALDGVPEASMLFALVMELVVTPAVALWQARIAHTFAPRPPPR